PQRLILSMLGSTIIAVVVASLVVFVQVERDQVLSLIAHTKPNHITLNRGFTTMVLLYAALPLLAVIATYFPALGDLFSYLDPVLRIFRG
ncbi:MAG TPA: hypothetical protein VN812_23845, partial [Candidatus Acidoferrales bacterium]|nr:hypothetical protein [Candidatus Acidoferrales bacterium]